MSQQIQARLQHAMALHQRGLLAQAQRGYEEILKLNPKHFDSLHLLGVIACQTRRYALGVELITKAIRVNPNVAEAYNNRGNALLDLGRPEEALASYDKALALEPDYAEAHTNRANALKDLKRFDEALAGYDKALALKPGIPETHYNRGNALSDLKRLDEAVLSYDRALALKPDYAEACYNRGNALFGLRRFDEALAGFDRALALKPAYAEAHCNRGNALLDLKRLDEALDSYDRSLALNPGNAEANSNRGNALRELRRPNEALGSYGTALALKPGYAEAYNGRGNALNDLGRPDEALASYDKALALDPGYAEAYHNRGNVLLDLKRLDEAVVSYAKALELKPDYEFLFGTLLHTRMKLCDWQGLAESLADYESDIRSGKKVTTPFHALSLIDFPELHQRVSRIFVDTKYPTNETLGSIKTRMGEGKVRIAYYSSDFHNHATTYLMAELFEAHETDKFELYGFSFGPDKQDEMRKRVAAAFDKFIDVRGWSDREVARYSRELGIDIAVDLKGFTTDARPGIFAARCAPVQVNYLGYPGTMGAEYMDYVVADTTVIPRERQSDFSEKVVYLPHSYQVNDSGRKISQRIFTRQESGLPESGFVFCCFNNSYKILPATFDGWMRILKAVKGSVLWLLGDNPTAANNLRKEAEARGVESNRLVFANRMPLDEHLARHKLADLFIDTLPCNAHTTASDALWAGLPVLTCMGKSFASRVAASLLNAMELPELVTRTQEEYEAKAVEFATDLSKLREVKLKLEKNRLSTPLFDARLFARHVEAAYESMYARSQSGLLPEGIEIAA
ncbi:MAG: tetratricopeptide repeat protein [Betaproteobacteria bacterium]|nr:tetratricopeptide repeat protein [Betaproteobacteria bacterium]